MPVPLLRSSVHDTAARRKAISVLAEAGTEYQAIANLLGCSVDTISYWLKRCLETTEWNDLPRSGRPLTYDRQTRTKIIAFYCQTQPLPGSGRWTLRWAQRTLEASPDTLDASPTKSTIWRILDENKLKPHRNRYFLHISDPDFFPKMEQLLALYSNPPENLFFFDECPGIQLLKRLAPTLQTEKMAARLEEFEYVRNGTTDVLAFLENATGKISAECQADHKSATFLAVFKRHVTSRPSTHKLHYVMDNLSTHRNVAFCQVVAELSGCTCPPEKELSTLADRVAWLKSEEKRIVIHFTPYHGSWLNSVEIWFRILNRAVLNESFGSPEEFKTAFDSFVDQWNDSFAHPFQWSYDGKGLHAKTVKRFTKMLRDAQEPFELRFLTKSLKLMTNLLNDYFEEVPIETWHELAERASSKHKNLELLIAKEEGLNRKKNAGEALNTFMRTIDARLAAPQALAA